MLAVLPVTRLSIAITRWPSARSRSHRCEPKKQAPPVTTETGLELLLAIAAIYLRVARKIASRNKHGWQAFRHSTFVIRHLIRTHAHPLRHPTQRRAAHRQLLWHDAPGHCAPGRR